MNLALPPWFGQVVLYGISIAAFWKGGRDERLVAAGLLVNVLLTWLLRDWSWPYIQWEAFGIDVLLLLLLVAVALRSSKYWPMSAAAFQLLAVLTHIAKLVDQNVNQWAYITAIIIFTYLLVFALGVGVWNTWRATRQPSTAERADGAAATRR